MDTNTITITLVALAGAVYIGVLVAVLGRSQANKLDHDRRGKAS